ncbi:hypothetical protein B0H13DRAFT_2652355 [Mycena leptocephala]|nr:hypothetical protein B0H13DRAFT_2652355 [Mycena leptocephala]
MQFKFALISVALAALNSSTGVSAYPKQGQVTFVNNWIEAGLQRFRFTYTGVDGDRIVHAFQNCGGMTINWQTWAEGDHFVFDDSEAEGIAGARVISCGIYAVTGQDCHAIDEIGC